MSNAVEAAVAVQRGRTFPPIVSVVMPVRNVEDWITESIESVLGQSLSELELIVVDDGSIDTTPDIVQRILKRDSRVKLLRNPNRGGASARNWGVAHARGQYLAFADGDDLVPEYAYEKMVSSAQSSGSVMVVGNYMTLETRNFYVRNANLPIYSTARTRMTINEEPRFLRDRICWNRIVLRSAWNSLGIAFSESPRSNDIYAMTQTYCAFSFDVVPEPVYIYRKRVGPTSMSAAKYYPSSIAAHFTQESLCIRSLKRLGDKNAIVSHYNNILEHDVWSHAEPLFDKFDPSSELSLADEDVASARTALRLILADAPTESMQAINERYRLAYAYASADRWDFAAAVLYHNDPDRLWSIFGADSATEAVALAHQITTGVNGILSQFFKTMAAPLLADGDDVPDDRYAEAVFGLKAMQRAGIPRARLDARENALISTVLTDDIPGFRDAVRRAATSAEDTSQTPSRWRAMLQRRQWPIARVRAAGRRIVSRVAIGRSQP